jgi:hypothetical protein
VTHDTWVCLGSSPSAPAMLKVALADYPDAVTITTNSGIRLLTPDYYFLSDSLARRMFGGDARALSRAKRTVFIARKARELPDILINNERTDVSPQTFIRGQYTQNNLSGLYCVQFALMNGAKTIVAVGHEGYSSRRGDPQYWDRTDGTSPNLLHYTEDFIAPWWRACVAACPDVAFHFYGNLRYDIAGPNVTRTPYHASAIPALLAANEAR